MLHKTDRESGRSHKERLRGCEVVNKNNQWILEIYTTGVCEVREVTRSGTRRS